MSETQHAPAPQPPYERIVFDCDSTLSRIEGIDELAGAAQREQIAALTRQAMEGRVPIEAVYGRRLSIAAPTRVRVATLGRRYIEEAVPQARETIAALRALGKELHVVSGGLHLPVVAFAGWLGIDDGHVHAVRIRFDADGRMTGWEEDSPLARGGGKRQVLAALPARRTAFVGDGMTDAEARGVVDAFVCFTGVVARPEVAALAHAVVAGPSLAALLPVLCTGAELDTLARDPRHRALVAR